MRPEGVTAERPIQHGWYAEYTNHRCRCVICREAWNAYQRRNHVPTGFNKGRPRKGWEPERAPLASIVVLPAVRPTPCPECTKATLKKLDFTLWPAVDSRAGRSIYACDRGHGWFASGAFERP